RDHAARLRRDREVTGKTSTLEKQIQELQQKLDRQAQEIQEERYLSRAETVVSDSHPVLRNMLKKAPDAARARIRQAFAIYRQNGIENPDPAEVIAKLEEVERQELVARGIDPDQVYGKPKTKPKNKTQNAGERKTAKPS